MSSLLRMRRLLPSTLARVYSGYSDGANSMLGRLTRTLDFVREVAESRGGSGFNNTLLLYLQPTLMNLSDNVQTTDLCLVAGLFSVVSGEYTTTRSRDKISVRLAQEKADTDAMVRLTKRPRSASAQPDDSRVVPRRVQEPIKNTWPLVSACVATKAGFAVTGGRCTLPLNLRYPVCKLPLERRRITCCEL